MDKKRAAREKAAGCGGKAGVDGILEMQKDLAGALDACVTQIEQMRGMFDDSDGSIEQTLADAAKVLARYRAAAEALRFAP